MKVYLPVKYAKPVNGEEYLVVCGDGSVYVWLATRRDDEYTEVMLIVKRVS
jgi:hypothetical protein